MKIKMKIDDTGLLKDNNGHTIGHWKLTDINFDTRHYGFDTDPIHDQTITIKYRAEVTMEINGIEFEPRLMEVELCVRGSLKAKDRDMVYANGKLLEMKPQQIEGPLPVIEEARK